MTISTAQQIAALYVATHPDEPAQIAESLKAQQQTVPTDIQPESTELPIDPAIAEHLAR